MEITKPFDIYAISFSGGKEQASRSDNIENTSFSFADVRYVIEKLNSSEPIAANAGGFVMSRRNEKVIWTWENAFCMLRNLRFECPSLNFSSTSLPFVFSR